jgi:hypothetical protein
VCTMAYSATMFLKYQSLVTKASMRELVFWVKLPKFDIQSSIISVPLAVFSEQSDKTIYLLVQRVHSQRRKPRTITICSA